MEALEEKTVELMNKFEALAVELAPEALDLGLAVARVSAAQAAVQFLLLAGVASWCLLVAKRNSSKAEYDGTGFPDNSSAFKTVGGVIAGGLLSIIALTEFSIYPFIGVFWPEIWMAHEILGI